MARNLCYQPTPEVSTHSRLKAAGNYMSVRSYRWNGFNTQPPKGGWKNKEEALNNAKAVSTHSRLKAAGGAVVVIDDCAVRVSTHSRLKAAGRSNHGRRFDVVCFNTQPPKGGWALNELIYSFRACFNTQPPKGGWLGLYCNTDDPTNEFQHTAA